MRSIDVSNPTRHCLCLSLLTWCFSPFPPPLNHAGIGLLSNPRAAYGEHIRANTHTPTWKTRGLWRRKIMYSHSTPLSRSVTPKMWKENSQPHRLDETHPRGLVTAFQYLGYTQKKTCTTVDIKHTLHIQHKFETTRSASLIKKNSNSH